MKKEQIKRHSSLFISALIFLTPISGSEIHAGEQASCLTPDAYAARLEALRKTEYAHFLKAFPDVTLIQKLGGITQRLIQLIAKESKPTKSSLQELIKQAQKERGFCALYKNSNTVVSAETCALTPESQVTYPLQKGQDDSGRYFSNNDVKAYAGLESGKDGKIRASVFIWGEKERKDKKYRTPFDTHYDIDNFMSAAEKYRLHPEKLEAIAENLLGYDYKDATFEGWAKSKNLLADRCIDPEQMKKLSEHMKIMSYKMDAINEMNKMNKSMKQLSARPLKNPERKPAVVNSSSAEDKNSGSTEKK